MRSIVRLATIGVLALTGMGGAVAQQPAPTVATTQPHSPPMEQRTLAPRSGPTFTLFGLPVWLRAPVSGPYCNCITQNYGGQPQRSRYAVTREAGGIGTGE